MGVRSVANLSANRVLAAFCTGGLGLISTGRVMAAFADVAAQRLSWAAVRGEIEHQARRATGEVARPSVHIERPPRRVRLPLRTVGQWPTPAIEAARPVAAPMEQIQRHGQERNR